MPITVRYACPGCGAGLEFDSKLQKMKCPYCDSVFSVSDFVADTAAAAPKPKNDAASGFGLLESDNSDAATSIPKSQVSFKTSMQQKTVQNIRAKNIKFPALLKCGSTRESITAIPNNTNSSISSGRDMGTGRDKSFN